jgi:KipI family sensor histidine kinase inhibitor
VSSPDVRWAGPRALLVQLDSLASVLALHGRLQENPLPGQVDVLAAATTVLAVFDSRTSARAARTAVAGMKTAPPAGSAATAADPVRIEVVYDGEDLAEVGRLTGLGADGVVAAHTGQLWTAAFGGFAPGFAYLVGENEALNVPRRSTPRTAVPAGSVALAGNFSAVYPRRSPGGWQLIGRTAARMWDLGREQPALLRPGATVQYAAVRELVTLSDHPAERTAAARASASGSGSGDDGGQALEVVSAGLQSLIQDLGRPGLGDLGVSAAGAADTAGARQANRLAGNPPGSAVIETVLGGLAVRAWGELTAALAGAESVAEIRGPHGARPAPVRAPFALHDGESLHVDFPTAGLRSYLAVRGGINVPPVLGSRSTDSMSGIGPDPLAAGTVLPVGAAYHGHIVGIPEPAPCGLVSGGLVAGGAGQPTVLRATLGPRDDWFTPESRAALTRQLWEVSAESNRIGIRLAAGPEATAGSPAASLERARAGELASEGVVAGSLQVPPSGLPVLFLADHPVTGGYPVIAVVVPEDLPTAAQLPPGTIIRFVAVDPCSLQPPSASQPPESSTP